jgi:hypothetical protein
MQTVITQVRFCANSRYQIRAAVVCSESGWRRHKRESPRLLRERVLVPLRRSRKMAATGCGELVTWRGSCFSLMCVGCVAGLEAWVFEQRTGKDPDGKVRGLFKDRYHVVICRERLKKTRKSWFKLSEAVSGPIFETWKSGTRSGWTFCYTRRDARKSRQAFVEIQTGLKAPHILYLGLIGRGGGDYLHAAATSRSGEENTIQWMRGWGGGIRSWSTSPSKAEGSPWSCWKPNLGRATGNRLLHWLTYHVSLSAIDNRDVKVVMSVGTGKQHSDHGRSQFRSCVLVLNWVTLSSPAASCRSDGVAVAPQQLGVSPAPGRSRIPAKLHRTQPLHSRQPSTDRTGAGEDTSTAPCVWPTPQKVLHRGAAVPGSSPGLAQGWEERVQREGQDRHVLGCRGCPDVSTTLQQLGGHLHRFAATSRTATQEEFPSHHWSHPQLAGPETCVRVSTTPCSHRATNSRGVCVCVCVLTRLQMCRVLQDVLQHITSQACGPWGHRSTTHIDTRCKPAYTFAVADRHRPWNCGRHAQSISECTHWTAQARYQQTSWSGHSREGCRDNFAKPPHLWPSWDTKQGLHLD